MKLLTKGWAILAALLVGGVLAVAPPALAEAAPAELPGRMQIHDEAGLFSDDAKDQAEKRMSDTKFHHGLHFTVDTHKAIPESKKAQYNPDQKARFFKEWAKELARGDRAKGPYVLICMNPGWTEVVVDEESVNRGFSHTKASELKAIFNSALIDAGKKPPTERTPVRDAALLAGTNFVVDNMKGTHVVHTDGTPIKEGAKHSAKSPGMGIGGWICLGLFVLLAIWLVVGLIRAFTGGGGGGGYGGGGGGGGWGGGFGTALFGGLFGAMAGMWLYNSFFSGSDASAADAGTGATDAGAGGGDTGGATDTGGDYGGGDLGGDYGGGDVGDFGGGGDF